MKRHAPSLWFVLVGLTLTGLLLAACGGPSTPPSTPQPTATATPRSTPLPEVPTAVPLASADRPLTILIHPQDADAGQDEADALAEQMAELTGLNVEVELVPGYGAIVAQLCSAAPVVGWLDGLSFAAAEAQACVDPALQAQQGRVTGARFEVLMNVEVAGDETNPSDLAALSGRAFCRVGGENGYDWLVAGLMLQRAGVNPLYDLGSIVDVDDYDALVETLYEGDCYGGVVPAGYLSDDLGDAVAELEDLEARVVVVDETPLIPFNVLVYPQTVPLNVRIPLNDVFMQIGADRAQTRLVQALLGGSSLVRVDAEDFDDLREFMLATGLDFAALGE